MLNLAVHVVDDDAAVLDACGFLLESLGYRPQLWADPREFLQQADLETPGVVLSDWNMPWLNGQQLQQALQAQDSPLALVVMTGFGDVPLAVDMLQRGAVDFLEKPVSLQRLQAALAAARSQSETNYALWQNRRRFKQLSAKEQAVARLLLQGHTNKTMAETLNVSVRTVEVHRAHLMEKMQADSMAALIQALAALEEGK
ncbi:response regulator [Neisseria shayeganii]|uniref:Tetrathionate reductase regulon response regulator n=2 Tax=Neisseria shayeganii TaxID=607712 RepID=G4CID7_9NEIS|nr:response regulator [Neisseria shayeganii]EGY52408.1 tetrathionate reductase regulon response regulator [Neisseria shayeganii 871]QMT40276.1 response regulator transcription factor [Neisseria shayeganii]